MAKSLSAPRAISYRKKLQRLEFVHCFFLSSKRKKIQTRMYTCFSLTLKKQDIHFRPTLQYGAFFAFSIVFYYCLTLQIMLLAIFFQYTTKMFKIACSYAAKHKIKSMILDCRVYIFEQSKDFAALKQIF